ncbi:hypothetical protein BDA99DRAFT_493689 [Phascolomyces articulosus]|uniref:Uncharacterized protein n=1 Tax=Phascolomyces articulosus TaxID=60185 RepID=A0AAD5PN11_9FUNG|nr:hypothetical protein BDA99DRAFT_493689 [Phascolomyces articulosus]
MTTLPSISNLLNDTSSHHPLSPPPAFHLSPPSSSSLSFPSPTIAPNDNNTLNIPHISTPALSPSTSCISLLSPRMEELPPLQGYDPPVRKLSGTPIIAPWSNDSSNNSSTVIMTTPPSPPDSSSSSCSSIPSSPPSHTYQKQQQQQQHLPSPPPSSMVTQQKQQRPRPQPLSKPSIQQQPTAQILISPTTGQPILKRRRGRPPSNREPVNDGGFTFLAPVTWAVQQPPEQEQAPEPKTDQHEMMAAFSSSNMDTVLQMPRKKRGRKPKTQLAGNSCFVWKELPTTRSTKKIMKKAKV